MMVGHLIVKDSRQHSVFLLDHEETELHRLLSDSSTNPAIPDSVEVALGVLYFELHF